MINPPFQANTLTPSRAQYHPFPVLSGVTTRLRRDPHDGHRVVDEDSSGCLQRAGVGPLPSCLGVDHSEGSSPGTVPGVWKEPGHLITWRPNQV